MPLGFDGNFGDILAYLRFPEGSMKAWLNEPVEVDRVERELEAIFEIETPEDDLPIRKVLAKLFKARIRPIRITR